MYDLHTHILPCMDDGAGSIDEALAMLDMEMEQGVDTVALTPHFYRNREHIEDFLERRRASAEQLTAALEGKKHPRLILGAEVAFAPGMADWQDIESLCYHGTKVLLVELPFTPWNDEMFRQLYSLEIRRGITPMIAHVERYFGCQEKKHFKTIEEMEFPIQISAMELGSFMGRRRAMKLLLTQSAILVSDCHNSTTRPPNLISAMNKIEKKLGRDFAAQIAAETEGAILE